VLDVPEMLATRNQWFLILCLCLSVSNTCISTQTHTETQIYLMYVKYYLVNLFVTIYLINSQYYQILLNTKKSSCINCKIFYVTGNIVPLNRWRSGMSSRTDQALLWVQFQTGLQNEFIASWDCHLVPSSEFCLASDDSDFWGSLCDTLSSRPD
jgi:hypothetical protein